MDRNTSRLDKASADNTYHRNTF
uniref:Uncharacterized protein n=1 Tax=Arundo donax TaxID=35708 RepID=A0A0A9AYC9_ARUDO